MLRHVPITTLCLLCMCAVGVGQAHEGAADSAAPGPGGASAADLAKKVQNPIADMISLPFQNNINMGVGDNDVTNVLNIQPVVPLHLDADWNLITRTIIPVTYLPEQVTGSVDRFGLGDINLSLFLTPVKPVGGWMLGAGPALTFPTATDDVLGSEKWSAGPTAVAVKTDGPWVLGGLISQQWSFAGADDRDYVSAFLLQPFLNYNLPHGWYLSSAPIITANWHADSDDQWTVPVGGGVGKVFHVGKQPMNASVRAYYNVVAPDAGPDWTVQLQLTFMFPK